MVKAPSNSKEKRLRAHPLLSLLEEFTKTYSGDPILLIEIKEFIESLNDRDKTIIYLRYLGFSVSKIAKELGVSKRWIRRKLKRIRELARMWIGS
ncbi:sigma-70 family RNA polymerase sigma factor [bacterium]|nr:sigma-70 family RNA polymerase sigma factor [bacterium]